jgi:hypothetical protein
MDLLFSVTEKVDCLLSKIPEIEKSTVLRGGVLSEVNTMRREQFHRRKLRRQGHIRTLARHRRRTILKGKFFSERKGGRRGTDDL